MKLDMAFFANLWARVLKATGAADRGMETENAVTGVRGSLPTNLRKEEVAEKPTVTQPLKGQEKA